MYHWHHTVREATPYLQPHPPHLSPPLLGHVALDGSNVRHLRPAYRILKFVIIGRIVQTDRMKRNVVSYRVGLVRLFARPDCSAASDWGKRPTLFSDFAISNITLLLNNSLFPTWYAIIISEYLCRIKTSVFLHNIYNKIQCKNCSPRLSWKTSVSNNDYARM